MNQDEELQELRELAEIAWQLQQYGIGQGWLPASPAAKALAKLRSALRRYRKHKRSGSDGSQQVTHEED
jgi:hypothetical protein